MKQEKKQNASKEMPLKCCGKEIINLNNHYSLNQNTSIYKKLKGGLKNA